MEGDSMSVTSINIQLHTNYKYLSTIMRIKSSTDSAVYLSICDIIGKFSIQKTDDMIKRVSSFRKTDGVSSGNPDYVFSNNQVMDYNLMDVISTIDDLHVPRYVLGIRKNQIVNALGCLFGLLRQGKQLEAFPFYQGSVLDGWNI